MVYFHEELMDEKERFVEVYRITSPEELEHIIETRLAEMGYKNKGGGLYEKGNGTLRLLFGAFHKHFKFNMTISALNDDFVEVSVFKQTTGIAGGVWGYQQVKKEMERLRLFFQDI